MDLKEKELENVAGGSDRREHIMTVPVDVPFLGEEVVAKPYLDGELLSHLVKTIDTNYTRVFNLTLNGSGTKKLRVKFNNENIVEYVLDFVNMTYTKL